MEQITEKRKMVLYNFYLEHGVSENEIPLSYSEWKREILPEEIKNSEKINLIFGK